MQDLNVLVRTKSGQRCMKRVTFDYILLDTDELVGEEIVEVSIIGVDLPLFEGVPVTEANPVLKIKERWVVPGNCSSIMERISRRTDMSADDKAKQGKQGKPGMLVEDETVVAGTDRETGQTVIKAKTVEGRADESMAPTDKQEG